MKPGFHHKLLNSFFEDPSLFVRIAREKRSALFDAGDIRSLSFSDIYKVTDVFITHTHIDHFIGMDMILRVILRREVPLNIYGPPEIISCIEGKLKGYTWNLIHEYPTIINVFSFNGKTLSHYTFSAKNKFKKKIISKTRSDGLLLNEPALKVRAAVLDHGIPCLGYSIEEDYHINIDKDILLKKGLSTGPWLTDFKKILRNNPRPWRIFRIEGKPYKLSQLLDIVRITKGQKISYVTDIAISEKNILKTIALVRDSDTFYCEAYFLEKDRDRAIERSHLTAKTCGLIAKKAGVKKLKLMHFSPKYKECPELVIKEALEKFNS